MKTKKLLKMTLITVCMCLQLVGCGADDEPQGYVVPCLKPAEAQQYIWLNHRQQELANLLNAGDNRPEVWAELNQIAPQIGYLVNASNVRNTASGCHYDWY